jgi:uncharacterized integral membrane protein (TIGR00698 family)
MIINKQYLNGVLVSILLGIVAIFLANFTPSFLNSILLALLIGIGINNVIEIPQKFQSGLSFTSGKMLELSIVFLAFSIDYKSIVQLGVGSFLVILITVFVVLISVFLLAKKFNCPSSTGWLIGFGTAICGSSAIAALAPSMAKDKEDVAVSMSVVNLFGSVGMILLPLILVRFPLDANQIGILIGGSLHSVGNVVGAGYSLSDEIGESAMTIKLARVALLSPALLFFNFLVNRKSMNHWTDYVKLPWYLIGFFIISIFTSVFTVSEELIQGTEFLGKLVLTIAMVAIGLKVSFKALIKSGKKGVFFGLVIFIIQTLLLTLGALLVG